MGWQENRKTIVGGVTPATGKKICYYAFRGALKRFSPNPELKTFDIWLDIENLDMSHVRDFLDIWGDKWRIFPVPKQYLNNNYDEQQQQEDT